jgi:hypothetical protein
MALAMSAYSQFENGRAPFGRTVWVPLLYQVLVVTPALLYFGLVFPDWTWLYLVDPQRLPLGITALFASTTAATLLGGYLAGWALLRARHRRPLIVLMGLWSVGLFVALLMLRERWTRAGSYADFVSGQAVPLGERKLGWSFGLVSGGLVAGLALSVRFLIAQGRRDREG